MSLLIKTLKLFVKTDDKLILYNSFGGRSFSDSPKAIFEVMLTDPRFKDYKLVWAFHEPAKYKNIVSIKTDNINYFITVLKARVWITNSSVERGLNFTGKHTLYFNTWHGTPMKRMGSDINSSNTAFASKGNTYYDIMMSQSKFETDVFSKAFGISKEKFLEVGLPRNDILSNYTESYRKEIREKLGIRENVIVILYAPTYREYEKDENYGVVMAPPMDLVKWENELPNCVLLFRAHYEVSKVMDIKDNVFVRNMTNYPDINDLFIASDILISDYSSVFFDYSITGKPMFHFTYDYDKYSSKRGMYFDIREYLSGGKSEDEIIGILKKINFEKEIEKTISFRNKFVNFYGLATQSAVDRIAKELNI